MALVDLQGVRQGDGDRFDVGVTFAGIEIKLQGGSLGARRPWPPSWVTVIFGLKPMIEQSTAWK